MDGKGSERMKYILGAIALYVIGGIWLAWEVGKAEEWEEDE